MTNSYERVKRFHKVFGHPAPDDLEAGDDTLAELRVKLIAEELCELAQALGVSLTVRLEPTGEVRIKTGIHGNHTDIVGLADAVGDLDYVVNGTGVAYGLPNEEIFKEVHRSNMSKMEDGKVLRREDGKILKGKDFTPPNIRGILRRYRKDTNGLLICGISRRYRKDTNGLLIHEWSNKDE